MNSVQAQISQFQFEQVCIYEICNKKHGKKQNTLKDFEHDYLY